MIPRTAVLLTLGSAVLIWLAVAAASSLGSAVSGGEWLARVLLTLGAVASASALFETALRLRRSAEEARARSQAIPVPVRVRRRRMRR